MMVDHAVVVELARDIVNDERYGKLGQCVSAPTTSLVVI